MRRAGLGVIIYGMFQLTRPAEGSKKPSAFRPAARALATRGKESQLYIYKQDVLFIISGYCLLKYDIYVSLSLSVFVYMFVPCQLKDILLIRTMFKKKGN